MRSPQCARDRHTLREVEYWQYHDGLRSPICMHSRLRGLESTMIACTRHSMNTSSSSVLLCTIIACERHGLPESATVCLRLPDGEGRRTALPVPQWLARITCIPQPCRNHKSLRAPQYACERQSATPAGYPDQFPKLLPIESRPSFATPTRSQTALARLVTLPGDPR